MSVQSSPSSPGALSHCDNIARSATDLWLLIGRVLIGWLFFYSGWTKLNGMAGFTGYLKSLGAPEGLQWIAAPAEFLLGALLILGFATRYAAVLGMLFMIVATALAHRYWEYTGPAVQAQFNNFVKNLAIFGAMFYVFVTGAGRFSLDGMLGKRS